MHQRGFWPDAALLEVADDLIKSGLVPQPVGGHDLVKLLQLSEAGDVTLAVATCRLGESEPASASKGGIVRQFLMHGLGLGRLSPKRDSEESLQHRKEALRLFAGQAHRCSAGSQRLGVHLDRGWRRGFGFVKDGSILAHRRALEEQACGGFLLALLGAGLLAGQSLQALPAGPSLILVELIERFVVAGSEGLKGPVVETSQQVEPEDIGLAPQVQIVGLDDMDQRQLDIDGLSVYHDGGPLLVVFFL